MTEIQSDFRLCVSQTLLDKDEAFKNGNKNDILYRIKYANSLIIYGVGINILQCVSNIGIKGIVKSFTRILDWQHFQSMEPIKYSEFSPYRRKINVTDNFDCYEDEMLNLWFVVNKTTNHKIKLFNSKKATLQRNKTKTKTNK